MVKGKPNFHDDCFKIFSKIFRGNAFASSGNWTEGIRHQHIEEQHTLKPEDYTTCKPIQVKEVGPLTLKQLKTGILSRKLG